ncbi:MAG: sterol desaturase family protein [Alphaproteobacteria bacterium]
MTPEVDLPNVVLFAIPGFVIAVLIEVWLWRRGLKGSRGALRYEAKDAAASLAMGMGNVVIGALTAGFVGAIYFALYDMRLFDIPVDYSWVFVLAFIGDDFAYYWFHRFSHELRYFWASHVVHHSSQHYNLTTALRQTWSSRLTFAFVFNLPLPLLGFHPAILFFVSGINLIYQFWIHTEAIDKMPKWFEAVMNTPSHHRVHHATNARYLDANYAGVFIIWDKWFGTFIEEDKAEQPNYGIVKNLGTFNPLRIATHEWVGIAKDLWSARSVREVGGYLFGPPGWSPDGSRRTSKMIKQEWASHQAESDPLAEQSEKIPAE